MSQLHFKVQNLHQSHQLLHQKENISLAANQNTQIIPLRVQNHIKTPKLYP